MPLGKSFRNALVGKVSFNQHPGREEFFSLDESYRHREKHQNQQTRTMPIKQRGTTPNRTGPTGITTKRQTATARSHREPHRTNVPEPLRTDKPKPYQTTKNHKSKARQTHNNEQRNATHSKTRQRNTTQSNASCLVYCLGNMCWGVIVVLFCCCALHSAHPCNPYTVHKVFAHSREFAHKLV